MFLSIKIENRRKKTFPAGSTWGLKMERKTAKDLPIQMYQMIP